jgi:hypothetical protein
MQSETGTVPLTKFDCFGMGQRVKIIVADYGEELAGKCGSIQRLRRADNGAWVRMDCELPDEYREFPKDDENGRGRHLLLYPEQCAEAYDE